MLPSGLELLRADVVSQKGLPIELDAMGKTARAKPSEKREVLVGDSAVGGEGPEVYGERRLFWSGNPPRTVPTGEEESFGLDPVMWLLWLLLLMMN